MIASIKPGTYIVAVSGGVDSIALLHALHELSQKDSGVKLVVAHVDHGMRDNSALDAEHVKKIANQLSLPFEQAELKLGKDASEEAARTARYNFLKVVAAKHTADAIATAHHQDDLIETAIINMSRGTGRHGLSSLSSNKTVVRPLLSKTKEELITYANQNNLQWREDPTNSNTKYFRNHIRSKITPKMSQQAKTDFLRHLENVKRLNEVIDNELATYLTYKSYRRQKQVYPRRWFTSLPHDFAMSIVHHWLKERQVQNYTRKQIEKLVILLKTGKPGARYDVDKNHMFELTKRSIRLTTKQINK